MAPRFTRSQAIGLLATVVIVVLGLVLASRIEWVEVEVKLPPKDEAAKDDLYTTKAIARQLGAEVVTRENFATMPPPGATLYLASTHWNMFEGRDAALRRWVEGGGNLILANWLFVDDDDDSALAWIPLDRRRIKKPVAASAPSAASAALAALPRALRDIDQDCHQVDVREARLAPYESRLHYRICAADPGMVLFAKTPLLWTLDNADGHTFLSARLGQGRISATSNWNFFDNENAVRGDNALLVAALLDLRAGNPVWFVSDEKREPVLVVLWKRGWPAVLLGACALAFGLWRSGVRFGPRLATAARARRSIVEQITGTARFIASRDGKPLLRAALRALDAAALTRIANYRGLLHQRDQANAIARATRLDAEELASAMDRTVTRHPRALSAALVTIEHARRALLAPGINAAAAAAPAAASASGSASASESAPFSAPDSPPTKDSA